MSNHLCQLIFFYGPLSLSLLAFDVCVQYFGETAADTKKSDDYSIRLTVNRLSDEVVSLTHFVVQKS